MNRRSLILLILSVILPLQFHLMAVSIPGKEWGCFGPRGTFRRTDAGIEAEIRSSSKAKRIAAVQFQYHKTLSADFLYLLTADFETPLDQPNEIVVTYRGKRYASKLGCYEVFQLKKGKNRIRCVIRPDQPAEGDSGMLSIQIGLQQGVIRFSGWELREISLKERKVLPFSPQWVLKTKNGKEERIDMPSGLSPEGMKIDIGARNPGFQHRESAVLTNEFTANYDGEMLIGCAGDWYWRCSINGTPLYQSAWILGNKAESKRPDNHVFPIFWKKGKNRFQVEILAGSGGWMFCWGTPAAPPEPVRLDRKNGYYPIRMDKLEILEGSALDLSSLIPAPAGRSGRVVISQNGKLALERDPASFRMFGSSSGLPFSYWGPAVSDRVFAENARRIARTMRRQGFNVFRLHGFDEWIMWETSKPLEKGRFLDRWDRLAAEMKKEGIYLHLVLFSFGLYEPRERYGEIYRRRNMHKARMFLGETWEMNRFRDAVSMLMNHVNPYTGLAWKDDPAIAVAEIYNEQTMAIRTFTGMRHSYPEDYRLIRQKWCDWLKKKYAHQPDPMRPASIRGKDLSGIRIPLEPSDDLNDDYARFWYELVRDGNLRCARILKDAGWKGIIDNISEPQLNVAAACWSSIPIHDTHTYLGFPSDWDRHGSRLSDMKSPVERDASFFRKVNGIRLAGRPFFCGEYNHSYWNPYQYELPLGFTAYAAFADWSAMMIHEHAVLLNGDQQRKCHIFTVGDNPIHRCGMFLGSLLFLRGDVKTAKHTVRRLLSEKEVFSNGNGGRTLSDAQNRLALVTRCELAFSDLPPAPGTPPLPQADLILPGPVETSAVGTHDWYTEISSGKNGWSALEHDLSRLRKAGILGKTNPTDPKRGIWQTDTGEITLYSKEKRILLSTERACGATLAAGSEAETGAWKFRSSVDALLYAVSVDGKSLSDSKRIVIGCATRAANTGMELEPDKETIRRWGTAPILIRTGLFQVEFPASGRALRAFALGMDGTQLEELKLKHTENGRMLFSVDTSKLKTGPAVFFELTE